VGERPTVLVAARDEEPVIGQTVRLLRGAFPDADLVVADDGSRDGTASAARRAGARVIRLPRRGKGQALALAERTLPPGPLLLCDADLRGDVRPLAALGADLAIAAFADRRGGGFGIAKRAAGALIRARSGFRAREPLSGQRWLAPTARSTCFPTAAGFGVETRMTIDAVRAGLDVRELEFPLRHRETGRDVRGFAHRARQLLDALLACGPLAVNRRGLRLPLIGWTVGLRRDLGVAVVAAVGFADDLWSGPERGFRAHVRAGRTTGVLKLVAIPTVALVRTRSVSGALLASLCANMLNQLDTGPGRALKAYLVAASVTGAPARLAVLLLPYDLREMTMLGDAGSNSLGLMLGLKSVESLTGRGRAAALAALAGLTLFGEYRSLGELIERTPLLRELDALGRPA
jgi:Glycosyl transferase family 2